MPVILLFTLLLIAGANHAQVPTGVLNESERGYYQTLSALADWLKQRKTPIISLSQDRSSLNAKAFYDTVINTFFDREIMIEKLKMDTSLLTVKYKLDAVRSLLNKFDKSLDTLHPASILIQPYRSFKPNYFEEDLYNSLGIWILKGHVKTFMLTFFFDGTTNKIVSVSGLGNEPAAKE